MQFDVFIAFPGGPRAIDFLEGTRARELAWSAQLIYLAEEVAMLSTLVPSTHSVRAAEKVSTALVSVTHGLLPPRSATPFIRKIRMGAAEACTSNHLALLKIKGPGEVASWHPDRDPPPQEYFTPSPMPEGYGKDRYDTHQWNEIRLWERGWPLRWG